MNIKQIIDLLKAEGYEIETYTRTKKTKTGVKPDSVRITHISGKGKDISFSKSSSLGNAFARQLTGQRLSTARKKQLASNRRKIAKSKLTKKQKEEIKKLNKQLKKYGAKEKYSVVSARRRKKKYGWKDTQKAIRNIRKHAKGQAYSKNIAFLIESLSNAINKAYQKYSFPKVVSKLERLGNNVADSVIPAVFSILYRWENLQLTNQEATEQMLDAIEREQKTIKQD